ncbi:MAG: Fe-S cluster assembly protein SufD [Candidatus Aenigmarchaeota archaeon]|nr:Fe-S cluster assembly protein SufD [Candidatus Aenigmarchaeota archaeon]
MQELVLQNFSSDKIGELSREEPMWLRKYREHSFKLFQKLPLEKSELFKNYASAQGVQTDFDFTKETDAKIPEELRFVVEDKPEFCIHQTNGNAEFRIPQELKEKGVILENIREAVNRDIVREYFQNRLLPSSEEKTVAFNNAFFNCGFFLYVPDNVEIGMPLRNSLVISAENSSVISQNVIMLGVEAKLTLIEESYSSAKSLFSNVTEALLDKGAKARVGGVQSFGRDTVSFLNRKALLQNDSSITWSTGFFGGSFTLSKLENMMHGNGSSTQDFEAVFGSSSQRFDITSNLTHIGKATSGRVMAKGIFKDSSKGLFKGMISIMEKAKGASAYLAEHAILLSKDARCDAIPGLEIKTNDVKATHSASVAQVSEEQLFYLMSRGFTENEAKRLIVLGFFEPLIRLMPLNEIKIRIKSLSELKWHNKPLTQLSETASRIWEEEIVEEEKRDIFEGHYKYR